MNRDPVAADPFELDDAAYLLGALGPQERARYEQHLPTCEACRRSLAQIAGLPGMLRRVPLDVVRAMDGTEPLDERTGHLQDDSAPPSVLVGLLGRLEREDRRHRRVRALRWVSATTAAAAAAVVVTLALTGEEEAEPVAATPRATTELQLEPVAETELSATVSLRDVAWGTRIALECDYPAPSGTDPYSAAPEYSLVVRDLSGDSEQVATWNAVAGKELTIDAATAVRSPDIAWMEIRAQDGTPVLRTAD